MVNIFSNLNTMLKLQAHRSNPLNKIFNNLIVVFFHNRMKERSRWDDNCCAARILDSGPIFHHNPNVDYILAVPIDSTAQKANESFISHDFLGDGVDEKAGVDKGLAGAFACNRAFGEFCEGMAAGGLGADAALDFTHQEKGVADGRLVQGIG